MRHSLQSQNGTWTLRFSWVSLRQTDRLQTAKVQNFKMPSESLGHYLFPEKMILVAFISFILSLYRGRVRTSSNSLKGRELANPAFWTQQKSGWAFSNSQRNLDSLWFLFLPPSLFLCLTPDYYPNSPAKKICLMSFIGNSAQFFKTRRQ